MKRFYKWSLEHSKEFLELKVDSEKENCQLCGSFKTHLHTRVKKLGHHTTNNEVIAEIE